MYKLVLWANTHPLLGIRAKYPVMCVCTFVQRGAGGLGWWFYRYGTRGQQNRLRDDLLDPVHHTAAERERKVSPQTHTYLSDVCLFMCVTLCFAFFRQKKNKPSGAVWCVLECQQHSVNDRFHTHLGGNWAVGSSASDTSSSDTISTTGMSGRGSKSGRTDRTITQQSSARQPVNGW